MCLRDAVNCCIHRHGFRNEQMSFFQHRELGMTLSKWLQWFGSFSGHSRGTFIYCPPPLWNPRSSRWLVINLPQQVVSRTPRVFFKIAWFWKNWCNKSFVVILEDIYFTVHVKKEWAIVYTNAYQQMLKKLNGNVRYANVFL